MINLYKITLIPLLCFITLSCNENKKSLVLYYDEIEDVTGVQTMRYIVDDDFLRIDGGQKENDFILFDKVNKMVSSVNHEDKTILKIKYQPWQSPEFKFVVEVRDTEAKESPLVFDKQVYSHQVVADNTLCTQVFLVKEMYPEAMSVFYDYQQLLTGQQVASLDNTPDEMQTPCFLADQVFHKGDYYKLGLPIQVTYSRGYTKLLKDVKEEVVDEALFVLPEGYKEYSPFVQ